MNEKDFKIKRERLGLSQVEVSVLTGLSSKTIINYEVGKKVAQTTEKVIHDALNKELEKRKQKDKVKLIENEYYMEVRFTDLSANSGNFGKVDMDTLPSGQKALVKNELEEGNYLVVRINGDAMKSDMDISLPDGTNILIKEFIMNKDVQLPIRGNLFVIVTKTGSVFKQVIEQNMEEGYLICRSYNSRYQDYKINCNEILQIFKYKNIVFGRPPIPEF